MKFINYLETISGIEIFPMFSLLVFFVFFILLGVKVAFMDKNFIQQMVNLPLEDNDNESNHKS
jgi:hypothetical protein